MKSSEFFIKKLNLIPHPEGGYFSEVYRSGEGIAKNGLPPRYNGSRSFATGIYYLLQKGQFSTFHRIKSDETWHFYAGDPLMIYYFDNAGILKEVKLGQDLENGSVFQYTIPKNCWFASEPAPASEFSLVGCTVAPGFDFEDFEMAEKSALLIEFPSHRQLIERLTK